MKAKLSKEGGGYDLYRIDEDGKRVTFASTQDYKQKLSLKNCQSIERGYDLDELAIDYIGESDKKHWHPIDHNDFVAFKDGFQKALELMGDKKFSINEVVELCKILMSNPFEKCGKTYQELTDSYIQSLQKNEWIVEIEMEPYHGGNFVNDGDTHIIEPKWRPALDDDGCLILKKINL